LFLACFPGVSVFVKAVLRPLPGMRTRVED
jgi:hypothetical protein